MIVGEVRLESKGEMFLYVQFQPAAESIEVGPVRFLPWADLLMQNASRRIYFETKGGRCGSRVAMKPIFYAPPQSLLMHSAMKGPFCAL
jgi:hypothetical protein